MISTNTGQIYINKIHATENFLLKIKVKSMNYKSQITSQLILIVFIIYCIKRSNLSHLHQGEKNVYHCTIPVT